MKYRFYKALSLGLCISMIAAPISHAMPQTRTFTRLTTGNPSERSSTQSDDDEIPEDVEHADYVLDWGYGTPSEATPSEATPSEAERKTFLEFFPDENFAQAVADYFGRRDTDFVTTTELEWVSYLYADNRQIDSVEGIPYLKNLNYLSLNNNNIKEIPDDIQHLQNLSDLYLTYNKVTEVPQTISLVSSLKNLDLSNNLIESLDETICNMTNLTSLNMSNNRIIEIPEEIQNLTSLASLYLSNNKIAEIPASINQLSSLQTLELQYNKLTVLPDELGELPNLYYLGLSYNHIAQIPTSIGQLETLGSLSLLNNKLTSIPDEIGGLTNLSNLDLSENQISQLPASIGQLERLNSLSLYSNKLSSIPDEIGNLVNLRSLNLSYNQISIIPDRIGDLSSLSTLRLYSNQISEIPADISHLINLQQLSLDNNKISVLPEEMMELTQLYSLSLSYNQISEIPSSIKNLTKLTELYIYGNRLTVLPDEIGDLAELQYLSAGSNYISEIPEAIYSLSYLRSLNFSYNQITSISDGLWNMSWISDINLYGNKIGEKLPAKAFKNSNLSIDSQSIDLNPISISSANITYESLLPPLILQLKQMNHGVLPGYWTIYNNTTGENRYITAGDGSEITSALFPTFGEYTVSYNWGYNYTQIDRLSFSNMNSSIQLTVVEHDTEMHEVTVIKKYSDGVLPEESQTYLVEHGSRFEAPFEVLEGYGLAMAELRMMPDFEVDMVTKIVSLDPVEQDYTIVLELDKVVNRVKLTTKYRDNLLPETSVTSRIRYGDSYSQTYEIAEGYQVANLDQLPAGVIVDENNHTVTINSVIAPYNIALEFEKKQFNVTITLIYEDGAYEDQVTTHLVPYGDPLETDLIIDEDYSISKVSFNAIGVSVNKNQQTVKIRKVTSPIQITIKVN